MQTASMGTNSNATETTDQTTGSEGFDVSAGDSNEEEELASQDAIMDNNPYLSIAEVTADQQAAFDGNTISSHFHPNVQPPVLGFDPSIIQGEFDPFSLEFSDIIDFGV